MILLMKWLTQLLYSFPARTTPVILMDANSHVGPIDVNTSSVGPYNAERPTWNGRQLIAVCEKFNLMLLNTWWPNASGSTWTNGRGSHSRIDFIAVPKSFSTT
eukprot:1605659-Heterocapsa_arctica.AAC.1